MSTYDDPRWKLWFLFLGGGASLLGTVAYSAVSGWTQLWVAALEIGLISAGFIGWITKGPQHRIALILVLATNAAAGLVAFTTIEPRFRSLILFTSCASMVGATYQPRREEKGSSQPLSEQREAHRE